MSDSEPCCSRYAAQVPVSSDEDDLTLNIKDEAKDIARLQLPIDAEKVTTPPDDDRIAKLEFNCTACGMHEMVHYFGQAPPFSEGIQFLEDTYVMRDPFQVPPPRWKTKPEYFIAIGAKCCKCTQNVCKDAACSFYYTRTYCMRCAAKELKNFPLEVQTKMRKQLAAK